MAIIIAVVTTGLFPNTLNATEVRITEVRSCETTNKTHTQSFLHFILKQLNIRLQYEGLKTERLCVNTTYYEVSKASKPATNLTEYHSFYYLRVSFINCFIHVSILYDNG